MDLSCAASHQDHHQHSQFYTEQDLPAPALGHHPKFKRKQQLDQRVGKHKYSPNQDFRPLSLSQHTDDVSHAVQSDLQGIKNACLWISFPSPQQQMCAGKGGVKWWDSSPSLSTIILAHNAMTSHEWEKSLSKWFTVSICSSWFFCLFVFLSLFLQV